MSRPVYEKDESKPKHKTINLKVLYNSGKPPIDISSEAYVFYFGDNETIGIYAEDLIEFLLSRKNDKLNYIDPNVDYKYALYGSDIK